MDVPGIFQMHLFFLAIGYNNILQLLKVYLLLK